MSQERECFEWVKASELTIINWPLCIRLDGGGAWWYTTVCSMKELNSHISEHNPLREIEYAKPIKPESITNSEVALIEEIRQIKAVIIHFATLDKMPTLELLDREHLIAYIVTIAQKILIDFPPKRSSLPTNKLTNSSIEQMAEEYLKPYHTDEFKDMNIFTPGSVSEAFIAGCKAIIELNKKSDE